MSYAGLDYSDDYYAGMRAASEARTRTVVEKVPDAKLRLAIEALIADNPQGFVLNKDLQRALADARAAS